MGPKLSRSKKSSAHDVSLLLPEDSQTTLDHAVLVAGNAPQTSQYECRVHAMQHDDLSEMDPIVFRSNISSSIGEVVSCKRIKRVGPDRIALLLGTNHRSKQDPIPRRRYVVLVCGLADRRIHHILSVDSHQFVSGLASVHTDSDGPGEASRIATTYHFQGNDDDWDPPIDTINVVIWDVNQGKELARLKSSVFGRCLSLFSKYEWPESIFIGGVGKIEEVDLVREVTSQVFSMGGPYGRVSQRLGRVKGIAASASENLIAAGCTQKVALFSRTTGELAAKCSSERGVDCVCYDETRHLILAGHTGGNILEIDTRNPSVLLREFLVHPSTNPHTHYTISDMDQLDGSTFVTSSEQKSVGSWRVDGTKIQLAETLYRNSAICVCPGYGKERLVGVEDSTERFSFVIDRFGDFSEVMLLRFSNGTQIVVPCSFFQ